MTASQLFPVSNEQYTRLVNGRRESMSIRLAALALLLTTSVLAQPPVPDTAPGKILAAWLSAFNSADLARVRAFDEAHRRNAPPAAQTLRFRDQTGGFTLLRIEKSEPTTIIALLEEKNSGNVARLELSVSADDPAKVASATVRPIPRPADLAIPRLGEAEALAALSSRIDELANNDQFSGAVLVARHGKIVFQKAAGRANRDTGAANTVDTQFRNGSMNKMFTAVATLQLVEAGKLALDDPLGKHLPDYPNKDVATKVTVRHLLTHTGGTGDIFGPEFSKNRLTLRTHTDYLNLYGSRAPEFEPGDGFRYSNYGFVLLGTLIERVSGMSYYDYVRMKIYEPAGMTSTGSQPESETVPNRSVGYMRRAGNWISNVDTLPWRATSAGGGYSTVVDFFRFAQALESGKLISKTMVAEATRPYRQQYGYGFDIQGDGPLRSYGHGGGAPGMNGDLRVYPELGYIVVALSNLDPPAASRLISFFAARMPLPPRASAQRQEVIIDDFESGALANWTAHRSGAGNWFVYQNGQTPPDRSQSDPNVPFNLPNPPQGKFAAVTDMNGPGSRILYRDVKLEGRYMLHVTVFYVNGVDNGLSGYSSSFASPKTLATGPGPNQQFRIDLVGASAPIESVADGDVLANIFQTSPGDPNRKPPTALTFDLSRWSGQTVRLRLASADNQGPLRAGVDDIRLVPIEP
jgi:D-alanyl-D-alanine carboxypeptidase